MAFVEVTKKDHIAVVTMNRPEALNALNKAVFTDLEVALDDVEKDDEVYVVIITGAGRAFIAGADIGEMAPMNVAEGLAFSELGNRILMRVDMMEKPTIAAVNGFALGGGCEMALACDIRIASEKAKFGQPEVGLFRRVCFCNRNSPSLLAPRLPAMQKASEQCDLVMPLLIRACLVR